ncbi:hypothetical protein MSAN_01863500 [Mycena sanguinolenta]|uniref:Uncharacterized protein n=1 Tax=Mycena sanguinolenta TaxID=230812 RepID=A0A8H6XRV6_9AGAR|nr:hypothetical protein MSAN_01863500 [Mycena sanguinolenta]
MAPLAQRANAADMGKAAPALLDVWIYFHLVSNTVLLPILVATFLFSKRAKRHPTLINVCMTWILSGIFSLLLCAFEFWLHGTLASTHGSRSFYAGQERGREPEKALCIAQASLLYGIIPMWAVAVFVLLWNMILVIHNPTETVGRFKMSLMLSAPYIVQIGFSTTAFIKSASEPTLVTRKLRYFYCAVKWHRLAMATTIFVTIVGFAITIAMIHLAILLYRNWDGLRHAGRPSHVHGHLLLRVFIFGGYIVFGFVVNIISMVAPHNLSPDMYAATIGTIIFLVFGTQADVLRTWCFWLPDPPAPTIYLPREPSWRQSLDLTKSAVPPEEGGFAQLQEVHFKGIDPEKPMQREKLEQKNYNIAWSEIAHPPTVI